MDVLYLLLGALGSLIIFGFSLLAGQAEKRMWQKVRVKTTAFHMQQQITLGRSHLR